MNTCLGHYSYVYQYAEPVGSGKKRKAMGDPSYKGQRYDPMARPQAVAAVPAAVMQPMPVMSAVPQVAYPPPPPPGNSSSFLYIYFSIIHLYFI